MPSVGKLAEKTDKYIGYFSVLPSGYPDDDFPTEPITFLVGDTYLDAWEATRRVNRSIRAASPKATTKGFEVHERIPIKFGGNPDDKSNRIILPIEMHKAYTAFWSKVQADVESGSNWNNQI